MSRINQQNYEAFYLDYLEGNLDGKSTAELLLFLENNPELKSELEETDLIILQPENDLTFDASNLQQHINDSNVEDYIIATIENEIEAEDAVELQTFLSANPIAKKLAVRYQKTILPKEDILFPNKNKLKRRSATLYYLIPAISAAAIILIFFLVNPPAPQPNLPISFDQIQNQKIDSTQVVTKDIEGLMDIEKDEIGIVNVQSTSTEKVAKVEAPPTPKVDQGINERSPKPDNIKIADTVHDIPPKKPELVKEKKSTAPVIVENNPVIYPNDEIVAPIGNKESKVPQQKDFKEEESVVVNKELQKIEIDETVIGEVQNVQVASVENKNSESIEALRIGQILNRGIRKNVLNEKSPSTDRIQGNEIMAAVAEKVDRKVKPKVNYKYKKDKKSRSFALSIGSFEFSRTKSE